MKKALLLILTLAMVACSFSSTSLYSASAYDEVTYTDEYENDIIIEKYGYDKDLPGRFFKADTRYLESLQLTDSQLQSDTATLLDLVLNSSLLNPFYSSEPGFTEYPIVVDSFNGLQELEKRADAGTVMVYRYLEESLKLTCGYYGNSIPMAQLYSLLIQDVFVNKLTTKEALIFNIANECYHNQIKWRIVTASSYYAN